MKFACCSVLATSDTLLRRAPIICAIDSWVSTSLSLPDRSRVCSRQRANRDAERGERAEDAVAADHRDLDVFAACELDDERDHAAVRKIGALECFIDLDQHQVLGEVGAAQMRADQFEIVRSQRGQKSIWRTRG